MYIIIKRSGIGETEAAYYLPGNDIYNVVYICFIRRKYEYFCYLAFQLSDRLICYASDSTHIAVQHRVFRSVAYTVKC